MSWLSCVPRGSPKYPSLRKDQSSSSCCLELVSEQLALLLEEEKLLFSGLLFEAFAYQPVSKRAFLGAAGFRPSQGRGTHVFIAAQVRMFWAESLKSEQRSSVLETRRTDKQSTYRGRKEICALFLHWSKQQIFIGGVSSSPIAGGAASRTSGLSHRYCCFENEAAE